MNDRLLKEYVASVLVERHYWKDSPGTSSPKKKKGMGVFQKVKSFFSGTSTPDAISTDWLEEQELYYDVELSDEIEEDVKKFARSKYQLASKKARGDEEKATMLLKRALDSKYKKQFRDLERQLSSLEDDDEDEEKFKK